MFVVCLMASCSTTNRIHEDMMYVTRKYIGDFDSMYVPIEGRLIKSKITNIVTDYNHVTTWGTPELDIPQGARCYVKYIAESMPGSMVSVWVLYFTWDGTADLYKIRQDVYTGEIY